MLEVRDLTVDYGKYRALEGLSLQPIKGGELTCVIGPNGCGKSTLLKAIARLIPMASGQVILEERAHSHWRFNAWAQEVVYLPQRPPAAVHLSVFEAVRVAANAALARANWPSNNEIAAVLAQLNLSNLTNRYLDTLSGGQLQLVALAQALIRKPKVLLLDEPLAALDWHNQLQVLALLAEQTRSRGLVTVLVSHNLDWILQWADRVWVIQAGQLVGEGAAEKTMSAQLLSRVFNIQARVEACSAGNLHVFADGFR